MIANTARKPIETLPRRRIGTHRRQAWGKKAANRDQDQRNKKPEDHAPTEIVGECAAEQRADAEPQHQEAGPCADGGGSVVGRCAGPDRSQGARHREGGRETLEGPSRQQLGLIS